MASSAERLKELREEAGLTQKQLAEKMNVDRVTISRWERGVTTPANGQVLLLIEFFKVSMFYITGAIDDRNMKAAEDDEVLREKEEEEYILTCYRQLDPKNEKDASRISELCTDYRS